ncbi:MAG TPA: LppX_LprAFG lipoprotein [Nocardioidaceae bacterium]|nr:LppX_LprAFG lipoprotein [Nocardioidaceae bacterium]
MTLRRISVALSAAALIVITGCGSSSDISSDDDSSESSGSSDSVSTGNIAGDLTLASFSSSTSDAQVEAQSTHLEMEMGIQGQAMTMSGDLAVGKSLDDTELEMTVSAPGLGQNMSMILVDGVMYMSEGDTGKYFSLDLSDPSSPFSGLYRQIFEQANPAGITEAFDGAIDDFEAVGSEEIDGTPTTHYRITVDTRKMVAKTFGEDVLPEGSLGAMPATLTYDVWVGDDDNLPRRIEFDALGTSAVMNLTDWGKPVDVQAPPPSQVTKKSPLDQLPSMTGSNSGP